MELYLIAAMITSLVVSFQFYTTFLDTVDAPMEIGILIMSSILIGLLAGAFWPIVALTYWGFR